MIYIENLQSSKNQANSFNINSPLYPSNTVKFTLFFVLYTNGILRYEKAKWLAKVRPQNFKYRLLDIGLWFLMTESLYCVAVSNDYTQKIIKYIQIINVTVLSCLSYSCKMYACYTFSCYLYFLKHKWII